jgi:hypothetical protein
MLLPMRSIRGDYSLTQFVILPNWKKSRGVIVFNSQTTRPFGQCFSLCGTPLPPHFELKTSANMADLLRQHLKSNLEAREGGKGKFHGITFGMNEKGGMDAIELAKYLESSILPLYPDLDDICGKRLLIKVDSGPGRTNTEMLAKLRLRGVYFVPGFQTRRVLRKKPTRIMAHSRLTIFTTWKSWSSLAKSETCLRL